MPRGASAKPSRASKARVAPSAKTRQAAARLVLQADCTLRAAPALKSSLLALAPGTTGITLEGGGVERIDTAGLQLLLALARREAAAGRPLAWASASQVLVDASAQLGLQALLGLAARAGSPP